MGKPLDGIKIDRLLKERRRERERKGERGREREKVSQARACSTLTPLNGNSIRYISRRNNCKPVPVSRHVRPFAAQPAVRVRGRMGEIKDEIKENA